MDEPLFPELPEDLKSLNDEQLNDLLKEHEVALKKVEDEDEEYVGGLSADEVLAGLEAGVAQIRAIKDEQKEREEAAEAYNARKAELLGSARDEDEKPEELAEAEVAAEATAEEGDEGNGDDGDGDGDAGDGSSEETAAESTETLAAIEASTETTAQAATPSRVYRRPPAAAMERTPAPDESGTALIAAAGVNGVRAGEHLDRIGLADALIQTVKRQAKPVKHEGGVEERTLIASAQYAFPPERQLRPNDIEGNNAKIRGIGNPFLGVEALEALVASGGLCAPLTPLYDIPDFAVTSRPVRDGLPSFQAERGGVSVPTVSTIGSIATAITVIEEAEDALGGTFATKSCQDMDCPTWSDVAVGIISHCREYGNLNARAWPEGIAHENNLTMAAHARTAETRLLTRIKALSLQVTTGQEYGAVSDLIDYATRAAAAIRSRLRMDDVMLRGLFPAWLPDLMVSDTAATQFGDRFQSRAQMAGILRTAGVEPVFYLDSPSDGTSQIFADEVTGTPLDPWLAEVQWALFIEGTFLHLDGGVLELGLVRDSTLNSTNDYQVFGETFENVARIGPAQAALWITSDLCPTGEFPALATARACS